MDKIVEYIQRGNNKEVEACLTQFPNLIHDKTPQGISLIQWAAYCRNAVAIDLLKNLKQELDIFEACCAGEQWIVEKLIEQDPTLVNQYSNDGFTPLGLASFFGKTALVKILLVKNADPSLPANNAFKVAPLHSACAISDFEICELLVRYGANVNASQEGGVTPLHQAAYYGNSKIVKLLLSENADKQAVTDQGQTPYQMAAERGNIEILDMLSE